MEVISAVARKYARALGEVMFELPDAEQTVVHEDFLRAWETLRESPEAYAVLTDPLVSPHEKKELAGKLLGGKQKYHAFVKHFVFVLADNNRFPLFPEIILGFKTYLDDRAGMVTAKVVSPLPLSEESRVLLQDQISQVTGKKIRLEESLDASLIGGVRVQVGDRVWDNSVKANLDRLRRTALGA